jgi:hypothetical protein
MQFLHFFFLFFISFFRLLLLNVTVRGTQTLYMCKTYKTLHVLFLQVQTIYSYIFFILSFVSFDSMSSGILAIFLSQH